MAEDMDRWFARFMGAIEYNMSLDGAKDPKEILKESASRTHEGVFYGVPYKLEPTDGEGSVCLTLGEDGQEYTLNKENYENGLPKEFSLNGWYKLFDAAKDGYHAWAHSPFPNCCITEVKTEGTIKLEGDCSNLFGDAHEDYYDLGTSFSDYFYGCKKMDLSAFDTSKCTNMGEMFRGCKELTDVDVTSFDTRRVKDMWLMFFDCKDLKDVDLSSFSTMSVDDHIYWKRGVWDGYRDGLDSILSWSMFDGEWQIHTMDQIEHIKVSDEKLYNYLDEHNVYGECNLELVEGDSSKFEEVTKENISDRVAAYKDKLKKFERDFGLMDDDEPDLECDGSEMEM